MERKEYLGRIKVYAIAKAAGNADDLERVKVLWRNRNGPPIPCFPWKYELSYTPDGNPIHTAILYDVKANAQYAALLSEVKVLTR